MLRLRAIGLMVLAMALLAIGDACVKLAGAVASPAQILTALGIGSFAVFLALARLQGQPVYRPGLWHPTVILRNGLEIVGAIGMVLGLTHVPLTILAAILQTAPLIVTIGAALILRERVGPRRWAAVAIGLCGMLMVIRPFGAGFSGWEIAAVLGVIGLALRDVVTRLAPPDLPALFLSQWGVFSIALPGVALLALSRETPVPHPAALAPLAGAIATMAFGYLFVTMAMRAAPAAVVAPFRYSRLIFNVALGLAIFGEAIDGWTLAGAALILGSGLYVFLREAQAARSGSRETSAPSGAASPPE